MLARDARAGQAAMLLFAGGMNIMYLCDSTYRVLQNLSNAQHIVALNNLTGSDQLLSHNVFWA
ncbi:MAG: hypothetical protein BCS36_09070 [Desulfovibrio sp. MES5]|nr:MAG: hypothetical protein BCS36_09070 [Desulfovibrio sp. MES5]